MNKKIFGFFAAVLLIGILCIFIVGCDLGGDDSEYDIGDMGGNFNAENMTVVEQGDYIFGIDGKSAVIITYSGNEGELVLPEVVEHNNAQYPVIGIVSAAFDIGYYCQKIIIPESVKYICTNAIRLEYDKCKVFLESEEKSVTFEEDWLNSVLYTTEVRYNFEKTLADETYEYALFKDNTADIISYSGSYDIDEMVLPQEIDGYKIKRIDNWLQNLTSLSVLEIPENIEYMPAWGVCVKGDLTIYVHKTLEETNNWGVYWAGFDEDYTIYYNVDKRASNDEYDYILFKDDTAVITAYKSQETEIVVPDTLEDRQVVFFGDAFSKISITTIELPAGIRNVEKEAFSNSVQYNMEIYAHFDEEYANSNFVEEWTESRYSEPFKVYYNVRSVKENQEYKYIERNDDTIELVTYLGTETTVDIPSQIDGLDVVYLGDLFKINDDVRTVTVPEGVRELHDGFGSYKIENLTLPLSLERISDYAFTTSTSYTETISYAGTIEDWCKIDMGASPVKGNSYRMVEFVFDGTPVGEVLEIPESITEIGDNLFVSFDKVKEIVFKGEVTSIGEGAFSYCDSLQKVVLPESLEKLGQRAFYRSAIQEVVFNSKLTTIEQETFSETQLTELSIPQSVKTINYKAFAYCDQLKTVTIEDGLESIGNYVFNNCPSLRSVNIPASVKNIGLRAITSAYIYCEVLSKPKGWDYEWNDKNSTVFWGHEGNLISGDFEYVEKDGEIFINNYLGSDTDIEIPDAIDEKPVVSFASTFSNNKDIVSVTVGSFIKEIPDRAFIGCTSLARVTLPEGLTKIGDSAFSGCRALTDIYIPSTLKSIGNEAFAYCTSLEKTELNEGLQSLGDDLFASSGVIEVTLPSTLKTVGDGMFNMASKITRLNFTGSLAQWCQINFDGPSIDYNSEIGYDIYIDGSLLEGVIEIPQGVEYIGAYAFFYQPKITGVIFPDSVKTISTRAFSNTKNLTRADFGSGLETIRGEAFYGSALTEAIMPANLLEILYGAFGYCYDLEKVILNDGLSRIEGTAFSNCGIKDIIIPSSINYMGSFVFTSCDDATIVCQQQSKPSGWADDWAGQNVRVYWGVDEKKNNGEYGYYIVDGKITITDYVGSALQIVIPDEIDGMPVISIGKTFSGTDNTVEKITLCENITYLDMTAFKNNTSLQEVVLSQNITEIPREAFYNCTSLKSVTMPQGITSIGDYAFYRTAIGQIVMPSALNHIGMYAFYECKNLTSVTFSDGEKTIDKSAFYKCEFLSELDLGEGIKSIGDNAFYQNNIQQLILPSGIEYVGSNAFSQNKNLIEVLICDDVHGLKDYVFNTCDSLTGIYLYSDMLPEDWSSKWNMNYREYYPVFIGIKGEATFGDFKYYHSDYDAYIVEYLGSDSQVVIPDIIDNKPVLSIGKTFRDNKTITSVTLGAYVQYIPNRAFAGCENLKDIHINDKLYVIGSYAFEDTAITTVSLPENLQQIYSYAFSGSSIRGTVYVPGGVQYIGEKIFAYTSVTLICTPISTKPSGWDYYWNRKEDNSYIRVDYNYQG